MNPEDDAGSVVCTICIEGKEHEIPEEVYLLLIEMDEKTKHIAKERDLYYIMLFGMLGHASPLEDGQESVLH